MPKNNFEPVREQILVNTTSTPGYECTISKNTPFAILSSIMHDDRCVTTEISGVTAVEI